MYAFRQLQDPRKELLKVVIYLPGTAWSLLLLRARYPAGAGNVGLNCFIRIFDKAQQVLLRGQRTTRWQYAGCPKTMQFLPLFQGQQIDSTKLEQEARMHQPPTPHPRLQLHIDN